MSAFVLSYLDASLKVKCKMIINSGIDIVDIGRIAHVLNLSRVRFIKKIFSNLEISVISEDKMIDRSFAAFCAKRFAAKESFAKALGCGIGSYIKFADIQIANDSMGKPYFIHNEAICNAILKLHNLQKDCFRTHLSISDEKNYAISHAIIESIYTV